MRDGRSHKLGLLVTEIFESCVRSTGERSEGGNSPGGARCGIWAQYDRPRTAASVVKAATIGMATPWAVRFRKARDDTTYRSSSGCRQSFFKAASSRWLRPKIRALQLVKQISVESWALVSQQSMYIVHTLFIRGRSNVNG